MRLGTEKVTINAAMPLESTLNFDFILLVATIIDFIVLVSISQFPLFRDVWY